VGSDGLLAVGNRFGGSFWGKAPVGTRFRALTGRGYPPKWASMPRFALALRGLGAPRAEDALRDPVEARMEAPRATAPPFSSRWGAGAGAQEGP
jgi:hypothetical protein